MALRNKHVFDNRSSIENISFTSLISYETTDFIRGKWVTESYNVVSANESLQFPDSFKHNGAGKRACQNA
jgi:hypothetical protein